MKGFVHLILPLDVILSLAAPCRCRPQLTQSTPPPRFGCLYVKYHLDPVTEDQSRKKDPAATVLGIRTTACDSLRRWQGEGMGWKCGGARVLGRLLCRLRTMGGVQYFHSILVMRLTFGTQEVCRNHAVANAGLFSI